MNIENLIEIMKFLNDKNNSDSDKVIALGFGILLYLNSKNENI